MNLLYIDRPLVINPALAVKIGLNEAIVLQQMHYWLDKTESGREHDGKTWIYNTYEQWSEQFPFWSESTIKRIVNSLKNKGLIEVKQLNKQTHDRTNYYTIVYESDDLVDSVKMTRSMMAKRSDPQAQIDPISTETTTETTTEILKPLSSKPDVAEKVIQYLNKKTGKSFRSVKTHTDKINARIKEGATLTDLVRVIDRKCAEWLADDAMSQYLRPATLFSAEKFNNYLGQVDSPMPSSKKPDFMDRHTGFADRSYGEGLKQNEDGSYEF